MKSITLPGSIKRTATLLAVALVALTDTLANAQTQTGTQNAAGGGTATATAQQQTQQGRGGARRGGAGGARGGNASIRGVYKNYVNPNWYANSTKFWYMNSLKGGTKEFIVVDAEKG